MIEEPLDASASQPACIRVARSELTSWAPPPHLNATETTAANGSWDSLTVQGLPPDPIRQASSGVDLLADMVR